MARSRPLPTRDEFGISIPTNFGAAFEVGAPISRELLPTWLRRWRRRPQEIGAAAEARMIAPSPWLLF